MHDASHDRPQGRRALPAEAVDSAGKTPAETDIAETDHQDGDRGGRVEFRIDGMMCHHCEAAIKKALERLPFVAEASADFETGIATAVLCGSLDEEKVRKAVEEEDYGYLGRV
jgi:Cu2+-exporting ATPase